MLPDPMSDLYALAVLLTMGIAAGLLGVAIGKLSRLFGATP